MKYWVFILSLYLVSLSCLPCGDTAPVSPQGATPVLTQDVSHESHACTPFCACACCMFAVVPAQATHFRFLDPETRRTDAVYPPAFYAQASHAIWHPPQIG